MNEDISKDPLYHKILKNRCLTCYKEEQCLVRLTEKRLLKMLIPEITLTAEDRVCEECDHMVKKMVKFRNTVLTAKMLLKTTYEQQCQDVERKISTTKILKKEKAHCSTLSSDDHMLHEEIDIKQELIEVDIEPEDSEVTMSGDSVAEEDSVTLAVPMSTLYNGKCEVKGEMMEVNKVTSNTTKGNIKYIPKSVIPIKDITIDNFVPSDGQIVMYDNAHAFTVKFMSETELLAYRETKKDNPMFKGMKLKCESCIKCFKLQFHYNEHMKLHDLSAGEYVCGICQQRFANHKDMDVHIQNHYIKFLCSKCEYEVASFESVMEHYSRKHVVVKRECRHCDAEFDTYAQLKSHKRTHIEKLKCEECGAMIRGSYSLKLHMVKHNGGYPRVECKICKKQVRKTSLKSHMFNVHNDKPVDAVYCQPCDQIYKNEQLYQLHLKNSRKHNSAKIKSKCEECGKELGSRDSLKLHMEAIHNATPNYPCDKCDQVLKTKKALKAHVKTKHGKRIRNSICDHCGKAFFDKKTLSEHMTVHTGARPHKCADCGATFGFKGALFTHRRLKHKVKRQKDLE